MTQTSAPEMIALELRGVSKLFGGNVALRDVSLKLRRGEVHALVGENGAGKSTLTRIMCGVHSASTGTIYLDGEEVSFSSPAQAQARGVFIMHQEPTIFPDLTVAENVLLGREPRRGRTPIVDRRKMRSQACEVLATLDASIDPDVLVGRLSVAHAQLVELAGLLTQSPRVLILDEPTAALTPSEVERMLTVVRRLRDVGVAILFITHRLNEVFAIADQVTVLRDGALVGSAPIANYTEQRLITDMVGRDMDMTATARIPLVQGSGSVVLEVEQLVVAGAAGPVDLKVHSGEIVAIAGLIGAGRTELARAIVGLDTPSSGIVRVTGSRVSGPYSALRAGLVYTPENRQTEGVALSLSISSNLTLPQLSEYSVLSVMQRGRERRLSEHWIEALRIKCAGPGQTPGELSGGNQQKVVIAKWLATNPKLVIFDEPTRGVDVGAKAEIHRLIEGLANEGLAVLVISSDLNEVLAISDRILVMRAGIFTAEFGRDTANAELVMSAAIMEPAA